MRELNSRQLTVEVKADRKGAMQEDKVLCVAWALKGRQGVNSYSLTNLTLSLIHSNVQESAAGLVYV